MENESVSRQEKLTCHCTKWHDLNRDQFRLKWSYKSRTWGSHFVPFFSKRRFEHSIHSRAKAAYIQSIIQPSSETQGQIKGAKESLNGWKNIYGTKKSKERREEPLGTMSYQTSSERSDFWLVPENLCFSGTNQKPERRRPFYIRDATCRIMCHLYGPLSLVKTTH